jgi:hypothetical protein
MRRGWTIDEHRVEIDITASVLTARVDGAQALSIRSNLLGSWSIRVGDREVELRRVRSFDVAVNQLWVDGVKVPHSAEPLQRIAATPDARCKVNRSDVATIECSACRAPVCSACRAVDGVRCRECFTRAVDELRRHDRANRIKGLVVSVALIAAVALAGKVSHNVVLLECAAGATVLFGFLVVRGLIRERSEAHTIPRSELR